MTGRVSLSQDIEESSLQFLGGFHGPEIGLVIVLVCHKGDKFFLQVHVGSLTLPLFYPLDVDNVAWCKQA